MRKLAMGALLVIVAAAVVAPTSAAAKTRKVPTSIALDIFGVIDRHGSVTYAFGGEVGAKGLTFKCMENRQVRLFHLEPNGTATLVAVTKSKFLGAFTGTIERPLDQIEGSYYADSPGRRVKSRSGKLKCLYARSQTILVELPKGLK